MQSIRLITGHFMLVLLILVILAFCPLHSVIGGSNTLPQPLLSASEHILRDFRWSADSQTLIFEDVVDPQNERWYSYHVPTSTLSEHDQTPTLSLSETCAGFYEAGYDHLSPNDHFLSYVTPSSFQNADYQQFNIGIGDCNDSRTFVTGDQRIAQPSRIIWSENSDAFVTIGWTNPTYGIQAQYVSGFAPDITNARSLDIGSLLQINGTVYTVYDVGDISADGNRVILNVGLDPTAARSIYLFDADIPSNSRFLDLTRAAPVISASFAPNNENSLWLFTPMSVIQYDLDSDETTIIDESLLAERLNTLILNEHALFSPDAHYIAIQTERGLFVLDLSQHVAQTTYNATSFTAQPMGLLRLYLSLQCPTQSGDMILGHVYNPNSEGVIVRWGQGIYNEYLPQGELEVPGGSAEHPGEGTFQIASGDGGMLIPIFVDNVLHDQRACFVQRAG